MRIGIFEEANWTAWQSSPGDTHSVVEFAGTLDASTATKFSDLQVVCVFIGSTIDRHVLDQMPDLKFIATRSTGVNHIDLEACAERGILISNVPSYGDPTIAEHSFSLLLMLAHRMTEATQRPKNRDFSYDGLQGFDLAGKTIGIVGTGAIGRCVVRIANGFGMTVLANDIEPDAAFAREMGFEYVSLQELLSLSDIVSLHVPLTPETTNMINEQTLGLMKAGAILINTARGEVVDTFALLAALQAGTLAAAGLDVLADEHILRDPASLANSGQLSEQSRRTLEANLQLIDMPSVVVTPHSAFNTVEAAARINQISTDNILRYIDGNPANLV